MLGHVGMVTIVVSAGSSALVGTGDVLSPKEGGVGNQGTNLHALVTISSENWGNPYSSVGHEHGISE